MPSGYVITTEGIFPSDTLFPSNTLYPESEIVFVPIVYPYDVGIYQEGMFPSETLYPSEQTLLSNTTNDIFYQMNWQWGNQYIGQSFEVGSDTTLSSVSFLIRNNGVWGDLYAMLYTCSGTYGSGDNVPIGNVIAQSNIIDASTIPDAWTETTFDFADIQLTANTLYGIQFFGTSNGAYGIVMSIAANSTRLTTGNAYYFNNSWQAWSNACLYFKLKSNGVDLYPMSSDIYIVPPTAIIDVYSNARTMWDFQPPSYSSYLNYLSGNIRKSYFKIELLRREDETVYNTLISDIVNSDGSTSNQNQEGVRRTCSFSLINAINEYTMFFSNLSIGNKFRLHIGYEIGTKIIWFCHGTYLFDNPTMVSQFSDRTIQVVGSDKWTMLNGTHGGILDATFIANLGSDIYGLVKTILNLNIVGDPMPPLIDSSLLNKTITYDITKQAGETAADLLLEIAYNLSCYIYYNPEGRLVIRPFEYDTIKASAFDLTVSDYNFLGMSKQLSFDKIYNAVQVRADNIQNADVPIIAEILNNDLTDPNSYPNYGIKKLYVVTEYTKGIDTDELAQARAGWELKNVKSRQSSITASTLPLYHLDVNDVVTITDQSTNDVKTRYLIAAITTPISTSGQVSLSIVRTTDEI